MRVSLTSVYSNIESRLDKITEDLQYINATISTGRKYQKISDNPVAVGSLMGLNMDSSKVTQYKSNLDTASDWLTATESTLESINTLIISTASLAEQMATGTYTAAQRAAAAEQVQQYMEEFMQMGNTEFAGHYLLSGYKIDTAPFTMQDFAIQAPDMSLKSSSDGAATSSGTYTGASSVTYIVEIVSGGATGSATYRVSEDGGQTWSSAATTGAGPLALGTDGVEVSFNAGSTNWVEGDRFTISVYRPITYQGDDNTLELSIGANSRLAVSQVGSEVLGGDGGSNDLFQIMADLKSALEANDSSKVGESLEELTSYQEHLTSVMSNLGAALNRVETKQNTYDALQEQLTQNIANKGDTDLVEAANALASKQLVYQAALQTSTIVMQLSLLDYL
ncbi:MAG: flagellar hook-associated protein FlgL [Thermodesulfobacteriota bacterium]